MKMQPASEEQLSSGMWSVHNVDDKVTCLRCQSEITEYRQMRFTFLPYGISRGHAMLVCPKCGHVEFIAKDSPLLKDLHAIVSGSGDDD